MQGDEHSGSNHWQDRGRGWPDRKHFYCWPVRLPWAPASVQGGKEDDVGFQQGYAPVDDLRITHYEIHGTVNSS